MSGIRHSKYKNTGILFELLLRQITSDILTDRKKSNAIAIVKEFFHSDTELKKELGFYQTLINDQFDSEQKAVHFINTVVKYRLMLNERKLWSEKYDLIKTIRDQYPVDEFFRSRVVNYKLLASIYKLFESEVQHNDGDPAGITRARFTIVEHISRKSILDSKRSEQDKLIETYKQQDKDLRLLTYKLLVDTFNQKYSGLNAKQRKLLKEYINNISNTNSLRDYVNLEVPKIKLVLKRLISKVDDKVTVIKINEVIAQADKLTKGQLVKDTQVANLLRYYQLIKELKNVTGK